MVIAEHVDHILQGGKTRIEERTDVLHGILGQGFEIRFLNAQLSQASGDADIRRQLAHGSDTFTACIFGREAGDVFIQRDGDISEALRTCDQVEVADGWQQDSIADAMRQVVEAAKLMRHGMNVAESSVDHCDAGQVFGIRHAVTSFHVRTIRHGRTQIAGALIRSP